MRIIGLLLLLPTIGFAQRAPESSSKNFSYRSHWAKEGPLEAEKYSLSNPKYEESDLDFSAEDAQVYKEIKEPLKKPLAEVHSRLINVINPFIGKSDLFQYGSSLFGENEVYAKVTYLLAEDKKFFMWLEKSPTKDFLKIVQLDNSLEKIVARDEISLGDYIEYSIQPLGDDLLFFWIDGRERVEGPERMIDQIFFQSYSLSTHKMSAIQKVSNGSQVFTSFGSDEDPIRNSSKSWQKLSFTQENNFLIISWYEAELKYPYDFVKVSKVYHPQANSFQ